MRQEKSTKITLNDICSALFIELNLAAIVLLVFNINQSQVWAITALSLSSLWMVIAYIAMSEYSK